MTLGRLTLSIVWGALETLRPGDAILLNDPLLEIEHFPDFFTRARLDDLRAGKVIA